MEEEEKKLIIDGKHGSERIDRLEIYLHSEAVYEHICSGGGTLESKKKNIAFNYNFSKRFTQHACKRSMDRCI